MIINLLETSKVEEYNKKSQPRYFIPANKILSYRINIKRIHESVIIVLRINFT